MMYLKPLACGMNITLIPSAKAWWEWRPSTGYASFLCFVFEGMAGTDVRFHVCAEKARRSEDEWFPIPPARHDGQVLRGGR